MQGGSNQRDIRGEIGCFGFLLLPPLSIFVGFLSRRGFEEILRVEHFFHSSLCESFERKRERRTNEQPKHGRRRPGQRRFLRASAAQAFREASALVHGAKVREDEGTREREKRKEKKETDSSSICSLDKKNSKKTGLLLLNLLPLLKLRRASLAPLTPSTSCPRALLLRR